MHKSTVLLVNLPQYITTTLIPLIEQELLGRYQFITTNNLNSVVQNQLNTNNFIVFYDKDITEEKISELQLSDGVPIALVTSAFSFELGRTAKARNISTVINENDDDLISLVYGFIRQHLIYRRQHALVVDDSRVDSYIVSNVLTTEFIKNSTELNSEKVIDVLLRDPTINIVVLDYEMPNKNGCQLMSEIKEEFPQRDFIFIGLTGSRKGAIKFLTQGVDDVFIKPLDQEIFSITLRKLIFNFHLAQQNKHALDDYKNVIKTVTKEVYNPIYVLLTINDCLLENTLTEEKLNDVKQMCLTSKDKLSQTFDDLLSYLEVTSYIQSPLLKPCSLQSMIASQLYLESSLAKMRNIIVNKSLDETLVNIKVPKQIEQVITHLTHNAIVHSKQNSEINIRLFEKDNSIIFEVEDTCSHLISDPISVNQELYSQTVQTNPLSKEQPLNFSLCRKVINSHGGDVGIKRGEEGNILYFNLPIPEPSIGPLH